MDISIRNFDKITIVKSHQFYPWQVLFAFMVGLHNLYWYYGSQIYTETVDDKEKFLHTAEAFQG